MLRDAQVDERRPPSIADLATHIRDPNYRVFAVGGRSARRRPPACTCTTPTRSSSSTSCAPAARRPACPRISTPAHAFYLGYEMCKAATALTLGKTYRQDEAARLGLRHAA